MMKIVRDGIEIELTKAEMQQAYEEHDRNLVHDAIVYRVETRCIEAFGEDRPPQRFLDDIGMDFDDLIADIEDEYRIHCENYDAFGLDKPLIDPFVDSRLEDYGMFEYEE